MGVPVTSPHRVSLPKGEPGRRLATWSLLMLAISVGALMVAGAIGTFLQFVVFDLEEQESLREAGTWGTVAGLILVVVTVTPSIVGVVLGARARRAGEHRRATLGIALNALLAVYLLVAQVAGLFFG